MTCNLIDTTISFNENTEFRNSYNSLVAQLERTTNFNATEVTSVLIIFCKFYKSFKKRSIDVRKLHAWFGLIGIVDGFIVSQILKFLKFDVYKSHIDPRNWVNLLHIFTSNNLKEQIKYVFQIYDVEDLGHLTIPNVAERVRKFFRTDDEEENEELCTDMSELLFQKFDLNRDGVISFDEYARVVRAQPLLLECLGRCLPRIANKLPFLYSMNLLESIIKAEHQKPPRNLSINMPKSKKRSGTRPLHSNDSHLGLHVISSFQFRPASKQTSDVYT